MTSIKLGFCSVPKPIYIYVKAEPESLWYKYDIDREVKTIVPEPALCCYVRELKVATKDYKGKETLKLDIVVIADESYVIRSGIETNFSKGFLLSLLQVEDLADPLLISVERSKQEDTIAFCKLFNARTKQYYKPDWGSNPDWTEILSVLQRRLGQTNEPKGLEVNDWEGVPMRHAERSTLYAEIASIMKHRGITSDVARQLSEAHFAESSCMNLTDKQLIEFRDLLSQPEEVEETFEHPFG